MNKRAFCIADHPRQQKWRFLDFTISLTNTIFDGKPSRAENVLSWNRKTLGKALAEWEGKFCYIDRYYERGRKKAEVHLPNLLSDIQDIVDSQSQTDSTFHTNRLYTRLSAAEVRRQLMAQKGYTDDEFPCAATINTKLNAMGYRLRAVQKSRPQKKIADTDAIFVKLEEIRQEVQADKSVLRFSMDAKATVLIGDYSRGGQSRIQVHAADHDFKPDEKVTPYCIFLPDHNQAYLYFTSSRVTSDFIADCLLDCWQQIRPDFPQVQTLLLLQDNGPENHSRRTQFMQRMVQVADQCQLTIQLAYYPPYSCPDKFCRLDTPARHGQNFSGYLYHSKYNPVERFWGILEKHWNGALLDSVSTTLNFARTVTWNQQHPVVKLVHTIYHKGVRLTAKAMAFLEQRFERLPGLEKYFVLIRPQPQTLSG